MDNRRLVIGMLLAMAIMLGWPILINYLSVKYNWKRPGDNQTQTQQVTTSTTTQPTVVSPTPTTTQAELTTAPTGLRVAHVPATQPAEVRLGSAEKDDKVYALALDLSPQGAGLKQVTLNEFKQTYERNDRYTFQQPDPQFPFLTRPLATRSIIINGQTLDLNTDWQRESSSSTAATYFVDLINGNEPVARIRKTYQIAPRTDPSKGYEIKVTQTIENKSKQLLTIKTAMNGVVPPVKEIESADDRQVIAGYAKSDTQVEIDHSMLAEYVKDKTTRDLTTSDGKPVLWFGASSVYFDAILQPTFRVTAKAESLNPTEADVTKHVIATNFETEQISLPPGAHVDLPMTVFLGPKIRGLLNGDYYASYPRAYNGTLTTNMSSCGTHCAFGWMIDLLVWLLGAFHFLTRDWGLAIICLVIVVRLLLHPVTKASTISMQKMGKMGPEVERLKKKYGDNKDELNKAMMQLYKEQGVGPFLGCLPMFLQMPIWIALYTSLQNTFELRQAPFLWGFTWIHDLAKPDHLIEFHNPIPLFLFGWQLRAINILPLLLAVVFYLQQKFQPKPAALSPEQAQQQKMMMWMSVAMFPLLLYTGPSGLNLYILTSTTVGILESKRIRDHIKQKEEAEKAGKVIVDGTKKMKRRDDDDQTQKRADQPKTGLAGWLSRLQEKADEIQRQAKRQSKRP